MKVRLPQLIAAAGAGLLCLTGALEPLERTLLDLRFGLLDRSARGDVVVVEIDPRSLRELPFWPWPRSYHAEVIERLFAAGSGDIAVDIDLSSRSAPDPDQRLAETLERHSGRVVLPAFAQAATGKNGEQEVAYAFPAAPFRPHVRLGVVNVFPDPDGRVRRFSTAELFGEAAVPTMAAVLAGKEPELAEFYADFGIRSGSIPRLSYVDVLNGNFRAAAVSGKKVIIGATAIELGDRFAVPVEGVLAGPVVQALTFETLIQGRALYRVADVVALGLAVLLGLILAPLLSASSWYVGAALVAWSSAAVFAAAAAAQAHAPVIIDVAPAIVAFFAVYAADLVRKIEQHAREALSHRTSSLRRAAMMKAVVEDSFDGIIMAEPDGTIVLANPSALKLLGSDAGDVLGQKTEMFFPDLNRNRKERAIKRESGFDVATGEPVECTVQRKDGSTFTAGLIVSGSSLRLDKRRDQHDPADREISTYTFENITERKATEAAQKAAIQEAQAASRAKTELLTNMGHELRTPLNAIIGFAEIIKGQMLGPVGAAEYLEYAGDIHSSGRHLLEVINDILDVSRVEIGAVKLRESEVCLSTVLNACVRIIRARRDAPPISVDIPAGLPRLRGDERLLKQIAINLLSNAAKFTAATGAVSVSAQLHDGGIIVAISDTGIGIPEHAIPNLTKPFYQVDSSLARKFEGTGLGLSLVSGFTALHGAVLEIESKLGEGTTVRVRFPAERTVLPEPLRALKEEAAAA